MKKLLSRLASIAAAPGATKAPPVPSTSGRSRLDFLIREAGVEFAGALAYGPLPRHRLDLFRPRGRGDGPIVLFLYGGAWTSGDRGTYEFVGTALAARGITTAIADYRLHPEVRYPAFVEDAALAYGWVDRQVAGTGERRRPIHLMGHSAGAHIAALLAVDGRRLAEGAPGAAAPAGLIGLAGPYAFDPTTWASTAAIFAPAAETPDRARPIAFVGGRRQIPALLLHGRLDRTVMLQNTRDFAAALAAAGGAARVIEYPGIGHVGLVSAIARPLRWRAPVLDDVVDFVETASAATP